MPAKTARAATTAARGRKQRRPSVHRQTWRLIRNEARSIGITPDEYLRLTGTLFATLRKAMPKERGVDGKGILRLVENPLFAAIIQYMTQQVANAGDGPRGEGAAASEPALGPGNSSTQPPTGVQAPAQAQPPGAMHPQESHNGGPVSVIPPEWQFW